MKNPRTGRLIGLAAAVAACAGGFPCASLAADQAWSRYAIIVERQPFGVPPASTAPEAPRQEQAFAGHLKLSAVLSLPSGQAAGFVDTRTRQNFILRERESTEDDIELIAVNFGDEEVTLRKGVATETLRMAERAAAAAPATPRTAAVAQPAARPAVTRAPPAPSRPVTGVPQGSYEERRRLREEWLRRQMTRGEGDPADPAPSADDRLSRLAPLLGGGEGSVDRAAEEGPDFVVPDLPGAPEDAVEEMWPPEG
jgi:hypothetical protein